VGTDDGAIEDQVLQVGVMSKVLVHPFPDAFLAPAGEPFVHRVPMKCQHNLVSIPANFRYTLDTRNVMDV
jgi:hypothetical protein